MIEILALVRMYAMLFLVMTVFMEDTLFEGAHREVVKVVRRGLKDFRI